MRKLIEIEERCNSNSCYILANFDEHTYGLIDIKNISMGSNPLSVLFNLNLYFEKNNYSFIKYLKNTNKDIGDVNDIFIACKLLNKRTDKVFSDLIKKFNAIIFYDDITEDWKIFYSELYIENSQNVYSLEEILIRKMFYDYMYGHIPDPWYYNIDIHEIFISKIYRFTNHYLKELKNKIYDNLPEIDNIENKVNDIVKKSYFEFRKDNLRNIRVLSRGEGDLHFYMNLLDYAEHYRFILDDLMEQEFIKITEFLDGYYYVRSHYDENEEKILMKIHCCYTCKNFNEDNGRCKKLKKKTKMNDYCLNYSKNRKIFQDTKSYNNFVNL